MTPAQPVQPAEPAQPARRRTRRGALARGVREFILGPPPKRPPPSPTPAAPRPPSRAPGIPELVRAVPRESADGSFRLNLIVPSVAGASTFGGVQTAIDLFRSMADGDIRRRIISVEALDDAAAALFDDFCVVEPGDDADHASQLVALTPPKVVPAAAPASGSNGRAPAPAAGPVALTAPNDAGRGSPGPGALSLPPSLEPPSIPVGPRDVFIATFWPTALFAIDARAWQATTYGTAPRAFAYVIQDFEPGFYPRSSQHLLARATYEAPKSTIAIFNTTVLQRAFHDHGLRFSREYTFEPRLAPALRGALATPPVPRARRIVVYGRPSKPRNGFGLIVDGLRAWRATYEHAADWTVVSAGESHGDIDLGHDAVLRSVGKLSFTEYADLLRSSAIGISLMISPHPSYPPLEMSHLGLLVLTNRYDEKDLSKAHPNIASLETMTVSGFADGLAALCRRFEADPAAGDHARTHVPEFLDVGPQFPFARDVAALLERGAGG
jgi:hypothetical protein